MKAQSEIILTEGVTCTRLIGLESKWVLTPFNVTRRMPYFVQHFFAKKLVFKWLVLSCY